MTDTLINWDKPVDWNDILNPMTKIGEDQYDRGSAILLCHFLKLGFEEACIVCYALDKFGVYSHDIVKLYQSVATSEKIIERDMMAFVENLINPMLSDNITREEVFERIK